MELARQRMGVDRRETSYRATNPAPIGGWNTRDSEANMPPEDAVEIENWIPGENNLVSRKGFTPFAALTEGGSAEPVETLVPFVSNLGETQLLAAAGSVVQRIDTSAPQTVEQTLTGVTYDVTNFANIQIWANGVESVQIYTGATFNSGNWGLESPTIRTSIDTHVFKNRVYYVPKETLGFWYTETFAYQGTVTYFPLTGIALRGGNVVSINSWTVDGGDGPEDFLVIFTSEGEVLVYEGSDPGTDFSIVGRYRIGKLVSSRCVTQIFGKLFVVTDRDYMFLPDALSKEGIVRQTKLSGAAADAVRNYGTFEGFNTYLSTVEGLLIINVPLSSLTSEQHIINVRTGAATKFTGINARCWQDYNGKLYFGGTDGVVYQYTGSRDDGSGIACSAVTAPSMLRRNREKKVLAYKPRVRSDAPIGLRTGLAYDFGQTSFYQTIELDAQTGGGVLPLDWSFDWPESTDTVAGKSELLKGAGRGTFVQLDLRATITQEAEWFNSDFVVETGGNLR